MTRERLGTLHHAAAEPDRMTGADTWRIPEAACACRRCCLVVNAWLIRRRHLKAWWEVRDRDD
jgi:hypothetical protein